MAGKNGNWGGHRPGGGRPRKNGVDTTVGKLRIEREGKDMPLDYMLRVMWDDKADLRRRDEMAKAAAPFLHARALLLRGFNMNQDGEEGDGGEQPTIPLGFGGAQVHVYIPDNKRRVAQPEQAASAQDAELAFGRVADERLLPVVVEQKQKAA